MFACRLERVSHLINETPVLGRPGTHCQDEHIIVLLLCTNCVPGPRMKVSDTLGCSVGYAFSSSQSTLFITVDTGILKYSVGGTEQN